MTEPIDPASPCRCGTGLSYGECHAVLEEASDGDLLDVTHRVYAQRWEGNATSYEAQRLYGWLTEHLCRFRQIHRVIDVGCGRGQGLAALRDAIGPDGVIVG